MTYNMFSGTLNPTQSINQSLFGICICRASNVGVLVRRSGRELRERLKWRHSLDSVGGLPQKGGIKDYAPDGSWLQERKLENFYSERRSILQEERVHTQCVSACVLLHFA